jgi:tetratricopeptide (TPR) repeat protein
VLLAALAGVAPLQAQSRAEIDSLERRGEGYWKSRLKHDGQDSLISAMRDARLHYHQAFILNPLVDLKVMGKFHSEGPALVLLGTEGAMILRLPPPPWEGDLDRAVNDLRHGAYAGAYQRLQEISRNRDFHGSEQNLPNLVLWFRGLAAAHLENYPAAIHDFAVLTGRSFAAEQLPNQSATSELPLVTNDYRYLLATMLYLSGRFQEAAPVFRRALEIDLGLYASHVQLARIYAALSQPDSALQERRLALAANPDDPTLLLGLAAALLQAGQPGEAQGLLAQVSWPS